MQALLNFRGTWGLTFPIKCMNEHVVLPWLTLRTQKAAFFMERFQLRG